MKTFYSVDYKTFGSSFLHTKWFADKESAKKFAERDFADSPVAHNFRNSAKIAEVWDIIREQEAK